MTISRKTAAANYTDQERQVLLTGVPLSPVSTRFRHPFHGGWNVDEIRDAWSQLEEELLERWESGEFAYHRKRYATPFAERILEAKQ